MINRIRGVGAPVLVAAAAIIVAIGAAVALAIDSDSDSEVPAPSPTAIAPTMSATETPTSLPPSPTATSQPATPVPPTATVAASEVWRIEFQRTGGFAGLMQRLSLDSDGAASFEDLRDPRVETGTLDAAVLMELRALVDGSDFFAQASPQEALCADCFDLIISVTLDGRTHTVEAIDIGLDERLKPFAERLTALLEDGLTP